MRTKLMRSFGCSLIALLCMVLLNSPFLQPQTRKQPARATAKKKLTQKSVQKKAPQKAANPLEQAARLNNLGVAYMGQQKVEVALAQFEQAQKLAPSLQPVQVNVGIALLNLQRLEPA